MIYINLSFKSTIHSLNYKNGDNELFIMRDDLLPFSFGGNKVRIANEYFTDMQALQKNCIISYGNSRSNLSRVIANISNSKGIVCKVISPSDNSGKRIETANSKMVESFGAEIIQCSKEEVRETIKRVINNSESQGLNPYYIYGDETGQGNEKVAVNAYIKAYDEIFQYELDNKLKFDYIFLASGTGTTQAGLICGSLLNKRCSKVVGISIARKEIQGQFAIYNLIQKSLGYEANLLEDYPVIFTDEYLDGGYGMYKAGIVKITNELLKIDGIALDPVYTGKAFWGMNKYIKKNNISKSKILFVHTGGLPLFFDNLDFMLGEKK